MSRFARRHARGLLVVLVAGGLPCAVAMPASASSLSLALTTTSANTVDAAPQVTGSGTNDSPQTEDSATYLQMFRQDSASGCAATAVDETNSNYGAAVGQAHGPLPAGTYSFTEPVSGADDGSYLICGYLTTIPRSGTRQTVAAQAGPITFFTDSDHDGFNDAQDTCPDQAGVASANGCPDKDGDGIADDDDLCPSTPGRASDLGCKPGVVVSIASYFRLPRSPGLSFDRPVVECIPAGTNVNRPCGETPKGSITYKVDAAMRRKLRLPSTTLGSAVFKSTDVGEGAVEQQAKLVLMPAVYRRLAAYYKKPLNRGDTIKFRMTVVAHLTAPVHETLTRTFVLGGGPPNVFRFNLLSAGIDPKWAPAGSTGT